MTEIPTLGDPEKLPVDVILGKLREKYELKDKRTQKVVTVRALRKEIYNLSKQINKLEMEIDKTLIVKVLNQDYKEV